MMFSLLFEFESENSGILSLFCGLCVLESIKNFAPKLEVSLKWPNDVFVEGKKICGILIERKDNKNMVAGIGVNLASAPKIDNPQYQAASLSEFGVLVEREEFLRVFLRIFNGGLALIAKKEFNEIKNKWLQYAKDKNKIVSVQCGNKCVDGKIIGVDKDGALLLATPSGTKKIVAGDVYE